MPQTDRATRAKWLIGLLELDAPLQVADIGARITKEVPVYKPLLERYRGLERRVLSVR